MVSPRTRAGLREDTSVGFLLSANGEPIQVFPAGSEVVVINRGLPGGSETLKCSNFQFCTQIVSEDPWLRAWDPESTSETFLDGLRTERHLLVHSDRAGIGDEVPIFHGIWEDRRWYASEA